MNILITGANGQLGSEIKALEPIYPKFSFVFADLPDLDICDFFNLSRLVDERQIQIIINCAAYTSVDKAEEDFVMAEKVNSIGVENLVNVMNAVNGRLVHISTDYVFDGTNHVPYVENDVVNPLGAYGLSKLNGERKIQNNKVNAIILRTSWLYSSFGNNFLKTMLRLGTEKSSLNVIFDQIGTPTYAADLARVCLDILSNYNSLNTSGNIYHYSNEGVTSWYDFAKSIMSIGRIDCEILPIESKNYRTLAKRPAFSVLNKSKIKKDFGIKIPYWQDSLRQCMLKMNYV